MCSSELLANRGLAAHRYRPFAKLIVGPREISSGILKLKFRDGNEEGDINSIIDILKESCAVP